MLYKDIEMKSGREKSEKSSQRYSQQSEMTPFLCFLLLLLSVSSVTSFDIRADVGSSCKKYQRTLQRAEPLLPKMGHRGGEAVDWYLQHWNLDSLSEDDQLRRETIADALRVIFGWEVDMSLGTRTKYYQWVAMVFPGMWCLPAIGII